MSEPDPNYTRQKVNWVDLEEDSEEEKSHEDKPTTSQPKLSQEVKKPAKTHAGIKEKKVGNLTQKEKHEVKNLYACEDLDVDDGNEKDFVENEKNVKKDNALSDLLKVHKKPEVQAKPQTLSKKEQKKKELEELDKILGEMGLQPQQEKISDNTKPVSEGEALNKKKKKKEKEEKKAEEPKEKNTSVEKKENNEAEIETPLNKEQALQAALKKHAEKKKQGAGLNLDSAKQEILARKEKAKKKTKSKKTYEEA